MKKLSLLFIALFATFQTHAQAPSKVWDRTFGGSGTQNAQSIVAATDGGYFVVGLSSSNRSGNKSENSKGGEDYWIIKVDRFGYVFWDVTIGGSGDDFARSVVATAGGGCIVVGTSSSNISGDKSEDSYGLEDYWVVKLDIFGEIEWDKTIGGSNADKVNSIIELYDGNLAIAGYSKSGISGNKTQASQGNEDYWIVKIDFSGDIIWDKTYGGSSYDYANSISTNVDGTMVVVGYSSSGVSGNKTEPSRGQYDYWVIKLNASGNLLWNKTLGGSDYDFATCLAQANDGGYVIAGFSSSGLSGDKSQVSKGGEDYWVVKLSNAGAFIWDRTIGSNFNDYAFSIVATTLNGDFIIGGSSSSGISGDKTELSKGGSDYWILKLNSTGSPQWDKTIGGNGNDYFAKLILIDNNYNYVLAGTSSSTISGDKLEANKGINDYWIVKLSGCTSTLTPTGTITSNQKAGTTVISSGINTIPNTTNITYQAGNYVQLNPGFRTNSGAVFKAQILNGCL